MKGRAVHLDTHVVCWLYAGLVHQLSETARSFLLDNDCHVSPWALLEMQELFDHGILRVGPWEVLDDLERRIGLKTARGESAAIVKASTRLSWANDPYDRMIVAHASLAEAPLLSKDAHLHTHFPQTVW